MDWHREILAFCATLAVCVSAFFHETLFLGKVLSPADVLKVSASFGARRPPAMNRPTGS